MLGGVEASEIYLPDMILQPMISYTTLGAVAEAFQQLQSFKVFLPQMQTILMG
jgi:hypothetical protein